MFGKCDEDDDVTAIYTALILVTAIPFGILKCARENAIGTIVPVGRSCQNR